MMIERLTSMLIYVLCLAFSYYILYNARTEKRVALILRMYFVFLCVLSFFYIPAETADLFRLREMSNTWGRLNISDFWIDVCSKSNIPVSILMLYFCGKIGIDGMLPLLATFIFYSNVFYILEDLYRRHDCPAETVAIGFLLLMSSDIFLEVISGIRCFPSIAILSRCFYDEIINKKSVIKNVFWCVLASLMHNLALVLYCIRIVFLIFRQRKIWVNIVVISAVVLLTTIWGIEHIEAIIAKASRYIYDVGYTFAWGYLLNALNLAIIITTLACSKCQVLALNGISVKELRLLIMSFTAITMCFIFEYSIFHRTTVFSTIMVIPLVVICANNRKWINYRFAIKLISVLLLFISCTRGNLSGYKFFLLW